MVAYKHPQVLELNPTHELVFYGPFEKIATSYLDLKNPSDERVCFKVKTTAPKRYCVRPNCGFLEPYKGIKIAIMLQPMDAGIMEERKKHKFMVQSAIVSRQLESPVLEEIWAKIPPENIMDSKLRCSFADDPNKNPPNETNNESPQNEAPLPDVVQTKSTYTPTANKQTSSTVSAAAIGGQATSQQPQQQQPQQQQQQQQQQNQKQSQQSQAQQKSFQVSANTSRGPQRSPHQQQSQSMSSFHDSLHQSMMSDDRKIVLVSLLMLILGIVLGKYII